MTTREPARIVAAIEIVASVRRALADEIERRQSPGWDEEVLLVELGRTLGAFLRANDTRPSSVEQCVESMRRVHAGLVNPQSPDAESLVRDLCPQSSVEPGRKDAKGGPPLQ